MIIPDKKKAATVIVSHMKDGGMVDGPGLLPEEELDAPMAALKSTAEEIMSAINGASAHDLTVALKSFFEQCDASPHEEYEEEE